MKAAATTTIPSVMRAVVMNGFGGPEVLSVKDDVPVPVPRDNEVLIKVAATAVNRADTMQRAGKYPPPPGASELLGLEAAGTIVKAAGRWKEADKVMCLLGGGGYAEYVAVHESHCMPVPPNAPSLVEAAGVPETFLTAFQCLRSFGFGTKVDPKATPQPPRVMFHGGASGVGTSYCQIATALGLEPVITASKDKLDDPVVKQICPKWRFERSNAPAPASDSEPVPLPQWVEDIAKSELGPNSIDAIVDPVIGTGYLAGDIEVLKTDGKVVVLAMMGGAQIPRFDVSKLFRKRASITGSTLRSRDDGYKAQLINDFVANVYPLLWAKDGAPAAAAGGAKPITPIISKVLPIDEVVKAHEMIAANAVIGKIVLSFEK